MTARFCGFTIQLNRRETRLFTTRQPQEPNVNMDGDPTENLENMATGLAPGAGDGEGALNPNPVGVNDIRESLGGLH